ncbi:homeobox domain protein, partial [Oesophagostomum dentatum]
VFFADPATRLETNGDGELVPQRRERYVFRPILIKILEGFFAQSPFPDLNKRVEIATTCNQVLQIEKRGVGLMPKEVVSPQVVANWFANKRKELRRRSQEASEQAAAVAGTNNSQPTTPAHAVSEEATVGHFLSIF